MFKNTPNGANLHCYFQLEETDTPGVAVMTTSAMDPLPSGRVESAAAWTGTAFPSFFPEGF